MAYIGPKLEPGQRLGPDLLTTACRRDSPEYHALAAILKGPEVQLPPGLEFRMGDDVRHEARTRWWDAGATTLDRAAIIEPMAASALPDVPVPPALGPGMPPTVRSSSDATG